MGEKNKIRAVLVFFIALLSSTASAYNWDFNYRNLTQVRQARNDDNQAPINQYVSIGLTELPRNFSFQTDFRSYLDAATPDDDSFDLYQAAFHVEPVEHFYIDGGRQWFSDGFDGILADGLKLGIFPSSGYFGGSIYAGIPRYIEEGDFHNITEGLIAGANLNLQNVKDTTAQLSLRWRKLDATKNDYKENDTLYIGLASSHQFSGLKFTPTIYGDVEADVAGETLNVGTLGVNLYPHWRAALTFEGSWFDVSRVSNETTIFGSYLRDEIVQGRQAAQIKIAKNLHFLEDVSYQHVSVPGHGGENGYTIGAGFDHWWDGAKLSSTCQYYYRKSFGGNVHGALMEWINKYFGKVTADLSLDVSRYSKVTNQKDTAVSLVGDLWYSFTERVRMALGGEFNHNNWFDREGRVTVNFEMGLDKAGYTPEKRSKRVKRRFHEI